MNKLQVNDCNTKSTWLDSLSSTNIPALAHRQYAVLCNRWSVDDLMCMKNMAIIHCTNSLCAFVSVCDIVPWDNFRSFYGIYDNGLTDVKLHSTYTRAHTRQTCENAFQVWLGSREREKVHKHKLIAHTKWQTSMAQTWNVIWFYNYYCISGSL